MNDADDLLRQHGEQAVRDLVELDEQVAAGEITEADAAGLRRRYEHAAARALAERVAGAPPDRGAALSGRRRPGPWALVYSLTAVVGVVAAVILLPAALVERPAGGAVTGNVGQAIGAPGATVTDAQLEEVVAANPDVVGMRLALADRYVAQGDYGPAMRHYLDALEREPGNAPALARLSWLLLQIGQTQPAWETVNQALAIDPVLTEALWFRANIQLDGLDDPAGALATLQDLAARDLPPEVAGQVQQLTATAQGRIG
ncbi:tetratricopeptide repeat protein [Pseudonocardia hydrocarbonoxydans]|uniref:tetratricopeptide repeat protein n=1 Tax=Pseudonocardia hydrocarbonoxydans TaxID=76726 RepID=UPI0031D825DD